MTTLMAASHQWATRPNDQRFLTLEDLRISVENRRKESWTAIPQVTDLRVLPSDNNGLAVQVFDPTHGENRLLEPTNWAFGQLSQYAGAPAGYLRTLPNELAA